ncbi:SLAM family member 6-like [Talpa occidentalis]|uniref:SLAM family member 6-like n=1 Tax=Talpa occidentalis TaxID=50954 RepID=UPI00188E5C66|nr:SLAM family member 6-like [Talpa occidentalis]
MVLPCNLFTKELNGVLGESITLPLGFPAESNIESVTWLHDGTSMIFITPEKPPTITKLEMKHRINVTKSYSLQLNKLKMTDSGSYKAQINTNKTLFSCYTLKIFRRVSNLHVTNHTQLSKNGNCEVYLTCSVENPDDSVSFGWQETGNMNLKEVNLTVYWDPWKSSKQNSYTCMAENPVSNISSSVSVQSLCEGLLGKPVLGVTWIILISLTVLVVLVPSHLIL